MSDLYSELKSFENLYSSFIKARDGKRSKENVAKFEKNLEVELFKLQDELEHKTYRPGKYHSFYRTEAKRRLISAAPFRDRVVHHALINIIEPIYEKKFIHDTYANRKAKARIAPWIVVRNICAHSATFCSAMCASSFPVSIMQS